uniref:TNC protein n=1 Tax=Fopius arisanus TaxID=64838 RepID=A0A0C9PL18_9HYME
MSSLWILVLSVFCVTMGQGFDLGPIVRIAQCKIMCIKTHSTDGTCDRSFNPAENICNDCWHNCDSLETQWEATKSICEGDENLRCEGCQTACSYRTTRPEEEYLPSSLPAPTKGPVKLGRYDVAVELHRVGGAWKPYGYYCGLRQPSVRPDNWILVILQDGIRHYSWEEWTPTLESLKDGPLVEATLSWRDVDDQLKRQRDVEQKRFNDRVRQSYLEKYGEKVLVEWRERKDRPIPEEIFRRFFFRRRNEDELQFDMGFRDSYPVFKNQASSVRPTMEKQSYVVSWEPETGGLMGNQVVDTRTAQISLLPGTKYLVRIASNDGPGSFSIEIDTRPKSVQVWRIKKKLENFYPWAAVTGVMSAALVIMMALIVRRVIKSKTVVDEEEV